MRPNDTPAFPCDWDYINSNRSAANGMTLRDYFAGKAMQGMLANGEEPSLGPEFEVIANHYASTAYLYANAMLRARDQEPS